MKYSEAKRGRVFVIRLEDGDIVHDEIERFAREKSIAATDLIIVGGADHGSKFVVGPEEGPTTPVVPMEHVLDEVHGIKEHFRAAALKIHPYVTIFTNNRDNDQFSWWRIS